MIGYDLQSCQQFQQTLAIYETLYIHNILHTTSSNVINVDIASQRRKGNNSECNRTIDDKYFK